MEGKEGFSVGFNMFRHINPSYLSIASAEKGVVTKQASIESKHTKQVKYSHLKDMQYFVPIAIKTLGAMGHKAHYFPKELTLRIYLATEDNQAHRHLIQRLSVAVQRGSAAAVLGCIGVGMGS